MAGFIIEKVDYTNTTGINQNFRFEYKLSTDSDANYILISASSVVEPDGDLSVPLPVTGLPSETVYYVRSSNNCESPRVYFIQQLITI